jgi:transposase
MRAAARREERLQQVRALLAQHVSDALIRQRLHTGGKTITDVRRSMLHNEPLPLAGSPGRPNKVTPEVIHTVWSRTRNDPRLGGDRLCREIDLMLHVRISRRLVDEIREALKFNYGNPRSMPMLTPDQERKRREFCQAALDGTIDWAKEVVISDESRFGLYDDSRRMWIQRGVYLPQTFKKIPKHSPSVMVWAAIGLGYKSPLIFIEGTLDASTYRTMLAHYGIIESVHEIFKNNRSDVYFQQDGAPAHTSQETVQWIDAQIDLIPNWPPNSPDLSPIENVWAIMDINIAPKNPQNPEDLKRFLLEEWDKLPQETIDHLIQSMPERFRVCLRQNGGYIGHLLKQTQTGWRERPEAIVKELIRTTGKLSARFIGHKNYGSTIVCVGVCVGIGHVSRTSQLDSGLLVELADDPQYVPFGKSRRVVQVHHRDGNPQQWHIGRAVEIQATVIAVRQKGTGRGTQIRLQFLLEFIRLIRESDGSLPVPIFGVPNSQQTDTQ